MESERPQWSAERRVSRSQGARGRLASVLRRGSHPRQGAARTRTERLFGAPPPSLRAQRAEGDKERGAGPCASVAPAAERAGGALPVGWVNTVLRIHGVLARRGWGGAEKGIGSVAW